MSKRTALTLAIALIASCAPAVRPSEQPTSSSATVPAASQRVDTTDVVTIRQSGRSATTLVALSVATGAVVREVPDGVQLPDRRTILAVGDSGGGTKLTAFDRSSGAELRSSTMADRWTFRGDVIGPVALSGNGKWLALVGSAYNYTDASGKWTAHSTFAVVDTALTGAPRLVQLDGNYFLDSMSDDGRSLYLIENKPNDHPATATLRVYDLASGTLADVRGDPLPQMNGFLFDPLRVGTAAYRLVVFGQDAPYLVRLDPDARTARVLRLPTGQLRPASSSNVPPGELGLLWSLVATRDGRTLYAANPAAGVVNEVDVGSFTVRRSGKVSEASTDSILAALARWLMPIADAKILVGRGALLSPDEQTLYLIGEDGIRAVDTRTLAVTPFKASGTFSFLSSSSDGQLIYALNGQGRWMHVIDARTGAQLAQVDVGGFPQAIVAVDAK
jgi:hypothetical protein